MSEKPKDLEMRTEEFAVAVRLFVRRLPRTISNIEDVKQLVRASGSVAANCIEANEALGDKDRVMKSGSAAKRQKKASFGSDLSIAASMQHWIRREQDFGRRRTN